ncbi:MAG: hypothetical protein E7343_01245 [Clostridiales bacterium]|nr:hypothetical protein [Clostridiales bacterium]
MTNYLLSVVGIVLISTVLTNILPLGKTTSLIKNILRLCAYLAVLSPIFEFANNGLNNGGNFFENYFSETVINTDESYIEYCSSKSINETERLIENRLKEEYSIDSTVTLVVEKVNESADLKIEKIIVEINDISSEKQEEIKMDFKKEFSVDIEFTKGG